MGAPRRGLRLVETDDAEYYGEINLCGVIYEITFWSPRLWARLAESDRPPNAARLTGGAWFALRPKKISSA